MAKILFVSATAEEAAHLPDDALVLITGAGTMNTAAALSTYLADAGGDRPERIVNVGVAGALNDGFTGVFEIHEVLQRDFDDETISRYVDQLLVNERPLLPVTHLPAARLATGDGFVDDPAEREQLAEKADLLDMEGYAVARIGAAFDTPVTLLKQVTERSDEFASDRWHGGLADSARALAEELRRLGWV